MLVAFYLHFLFFAKSLCYAHVSCFITRDEVTGASIPEPSLSDCHHIIAHLPQPPDGLADSLSANISGGIEDAFSSISPGHPFFPFNEVNHDSCVLILRYYEGHLPPSLYDIAPAEEKGLPRRPLPEQGMRKLLGAQRKAAQRVAAACVQHGLAGLEWSMVDLPGIPLAWYVAYLTRSRVSGGAARDLRIAQRQALGEYGYMLQPPFRISFYDV